MEYTTITLRSAQVPQIPQLEAIDSENLLTHIIAQLGSGSYCFVSHYPGSPLAIRGYKAPLQESEILLHICLRDYQGEMPAGADINEAMLGYITQKDVKVVQAVRHAHGPHTRIVANLDRPSR